MFTDCPVSVKPSLAIGIGLKAIDAGYKVSFNTPLGRFMLGGESYRLKTKLIQSS
ncbi:hypothetical protein Q9L42_013870 [Methylomarinum sp. Ch1-1]|uniref:Uncharacterized protein n=1 Tax=Methylomarinum roseum TaxID=3067653 RepID=A0AAU7NR76_9GAMM|nr:hypothetical protein [Methylomarinum sp. Ch1-1]MDP4520591.1 hypothetical protein [Methylomarinum sp. Ch1-1]